MNIELICFVGSFGAYVLSFLAHCVAATQNRPGFYKAGRALAFVGALLGTVGLSIRWKESGHPPLSNMPESLYSLATIFAWVTLFFTASAPFPLIEAGAAVGAILMTGLASVFGNEIRPLVPALQSYWLHLHVSIAFIGEACFALAFILSYLYCARRLVEAANPPTDNGSGGPSGSTCMSENEKGLETSSEKKKKCKFCGETIAWEAIKCRFCNEFLDGSVSPSKMNFEIIFQIIGVLGVITIGLAFFLPLFRSSGSSLSLMDAMQKQPSATGQEPSLIRFFVVFMVPNLFIFICFLSRNYLKSLFFSLLYGAAFFLTLLEPEKSFGEFGKPTGVAVFVCGLAIITVIASAILGSIYSKKDPEENEEDACVAVVYGLPLAVVALLAFILMKLSGSQESASQFKSVLFWVLIPFLVGGGGFLAALFLARRSLSQVADRWLPSLDRLDEMTYRAISLGYPLFTIGAIIFGMVWANKAWGRYWGWDPKETWALITFLVYSGYLHLRMTKGWKGTGPAVLSVVGFLFTIFTLFGVNMILSGLHSYGSK